MPWAFKDADASDYSLEATVTSEDDVIIATTRPSAMTSEDA